MFPRSFLIIDPIAGDKDILSPLSPLVPPYRFAPVAAIKFHISYLHAGGRDASRAEVHAIRNVVTDDPYFTARRKDHFLARGRLASPPCERASARHESRPVFRLAILRRRVSPGGYGRAGARGEAGMGGFGCGSTNVKYIRAEIKNVCRRAEGGGAGGLRIRNRRRSIVRGGASRDSFNQSLSSRIVLKMRTIRGK